MLVRDLGNGFDVEDVAAGIGDGFAIQALGFRGDGFLDLARKMARHSVTEARRAVMGLRASTLLCAGGVLAIPTESSYGLGADPLKDVRASSV